MIEIIHRENVKIGEADFKKTVFKFVFGIFYV